MSKDEYKTIKGISQSKLVVKKSRFFGLASNIELPEAADNFLEYAKGKYPKASHYCYAYTIGHSSGTLALPTKKKIERTLRELRASDAGEPTNSAGPPILSAIHASELDNIICVVVRYFGRIKLGIGGLIRAYGKCARDCLQSAEIVKRVFYQPLLIKTPHQFIGNVISLGKSYRGEIVDVGYDKVAEIHLKIRGGEIDIFLSALKGIISDITIERG